MYLKSLQIYKASDIAERELEICYLLGKMKDKAGLLEWGEVYFQQALDIHRHTGIKTPQWLIQRMNRGFR